MESVRLGTLDFILTRPADAQVLVSVQQVQIWNLVEVAIGLGILLWSLVHLGARVGLAQAGAFGVTLLAGAAIISRLTWPNLVITLALAAALLTLSRRFWRYGLRHYSGASA